MDIYLIRHTEVAVGRSIAYGQADVDLADTYEEQWDRLQQHLTHDPNWTQSGGMQPTVIFSSPLIRCRRLAEDLADFLTTGSAIETAPGQTATVDSHRPAVQFDDRLKEIYFGDWEMKPWSEIDRAVLAAWRVDFVQTPIPGGENFREVFERVGGFWQEQIQPLTQNGPTQPIYVVTHGGVIRALLCHLLELPLLNAYRLNLDYGAVTKVTLTASTCTVQYINR